jgi:AsmA protein
MAGKRLRRGLLLLTTLCLLVAIMVAAIPLLISTDFIRERLAAELGSWIGYRVELRASPDISVFPRLNATLNKVVVKDWTDADRKPLMEAEAVSVDLGAWAAMRGKFEFSAIRVIRPQFRDVDFAADFGALVPRFGKLARAMNIARAAIADNPANPDMTRLDDDAVGRLVIVDGLVFSGQTDDPRHQLSSVNLTLVLPTLNGSGQLTANAIWNGENVQLTAQAQRPLLMFAGGTSVIKAEMKGNTGSLAYDGTVNLSGNPYADGAVTFATPSTNRLMQWSGINIGPGAALNAVSVSGRFSGVPSRFKLSDAVVGIDGNASKGVVEFAMVDAVPNVTATLAFGTIDLGSILTAFVPAPKLSIAAQEEIDTLFLHELGLDIRLSAQTARAGALNLSNVAATAQIRGGVAAFDLNDAGLDGGTVQASLRLDGTDESPTGELRLSLRAIPTGGLFGKAPPEPFAINAPGSLSLMLRGPFPSWRGFVDAAGGTFMAKLGAGQVSGFTLANLYASKATETIYPLGSATGGSFNFDRAELKGTVADATLHIEHGSLHTPNFDLSLEGVIAVLDRSLAMIGKVKPTVGEAPLQRPYFIGGSWDNPFVSPVLMPPFAP